MTVVDGMVIFAVGLTGGVIISALPWLVGSVVAFFRSVFGGK